jgi:hypothetical protein
MTHYDIWVSKDSEHLIVTPVDKGYEVMDEVLEMMAKDNHCISEIYRDGSFWFPIAKVDEAKAADNVS